VPLNSLNGSTLQCGMGYDIVVEQLKRHRQMKDERDRLQTECCQLREQKDSFMDQCHRLREKIGKSLTLAVTKTKLVGVAISQ